MKKQPLIDQQDYLSHYFLVKECIEKIYAFEVTRKDEEVYDEALIDRGDLKKVVDSIKSKFGLDMKFALVFGAGITALYNPVAKFYASQSVSLSKEELIMLCVAFVGSMRKEDFAKSKKLINNIFSSNKKMYALATTASTLLKGIMKKLGGMTNLVAYTVLLVPIMSAIQDVAGGSLTSINMDTVKNILIGMSANMAIHTLGTQGSFKSLYNNLKKKLVK